MVRAKLPWVFCWQVFKKYNVNPDWVPWIQSFIESRQLDVNPFIFYNGILFKRHDMNWHELFAATCDDEFWLELSNVSRARLSLHLSLSHGRTRRCTKNAPASEVLQCNFVPSDVHKMEYKHHRQGCRADTLSRCLWLYNQDSSAYHSALLHIHLQRLWPALGPNVLPSYIAAKNVSAL